MRLLEDLDAEIALVPLLGHSIGHAGVAVSGELRLAASRGRRLLPPQEVATPPSCPPGLRLFQNIVGHNQKARRANQERLRELVRSHGDEVRVFCAHSPVELERERAREGA